MKSVSVLLVVAPAPTAAGCTDRYEEPPEDRIRFERNSAFGGGTVRFFVKLEDGTEVSVNSDDDVSGSAPEATPFLHLPALAVRQDVELPVFVSDGEKVRLFAEVRWAATHQMYDWAPGVTTRQAASRLLRCAPALRVTRRNPRRSGLSMAGRGLPAIGAGYPRFADSSLSSGDRRGSLARSRE